MLYHSWSNFIERELQELVNTGVNVTTNSYNKTGFSPFIPNTESWRQVLGSLGKMNKWLKKKNSEINEKEYEIKVQEGVDINSVLTKKEQALLVEGMHSSTTPTDAAFCHMCAMLAQLI